MSDVFLIEGLEANGWDVTVLSQDEFTASSHEIFFPDLIVFGERLSSSAVTPFADAGFPTPVVSLEGYCTRSNRWALLASDDDFGQIRIDESFGIAPIIPDHYTNKVIGDHPIIAASGLSVDDVFTWSTETADTLQPEVVWYNSMPQATATPLTDIGGETADLHTMWTLEPDASDTTNPLQHKMVIWGVHENGFYSLTDDFWSVLNNSMLWVLDSLEEEMTGGDRESLLYISRNTPPDGNDPDVIAGLEDLGYVVTAISADEFTPSSHEIFFPDVIVFGEYLSSSGVTPFAEADFPTPCVSLEGYCTRSNRWALLASDDDFGQIRLDESFGIAPIIPDHYTNKVIADHPILSNAGLSVDDVFTWSTQDTAAPEVVWYNSMPQAAATPLTDIGGEVADLHTMWAMEPDASDTTNPLNHRLVIWGVHDNGLNATTEEFWSIMDNSIQWVLGNLSTSNKVVDILNNNLSNFPNPFSEMTQIQFNLKKAAHVELQVHDALGRLVDSQKGYFTSGDQVMPYARKNLNNGVYYYSLFADGLFAGTGKMMIK